MVGTELAFNLIMKLIFLILLSLGQAHAQFGTATTIEQVESFVKGRQLKSVEEFLEALDDDQKDHYVMMYDSKSLQGASFQKPRVIMFSKTGEILFSFNGDTTQKNGNKIEMILFDENTSKFRAHEIEFTGTSAIVRKDPAICMSCHGTDIRPNWNNYNQWEGAYGSNDARLSEREYQELEVFKRSHQDHPRYRHLGNVRSRYQPTGDPRYSRTVRTDIFNLTQEVLNLNFKRVKRIVKSHEQYEKFKYPLVALFSECSIRDYKTLLPREYYSKIHSDFEASNKVYESQYERDRDLMRLQFLNALGIETAFIDTRFSPKDEEAAKNEMFGSVFTTPEKFQAEFTYLMGSDDEDLMHLLTPSMIGGTYINRSSDIDCKKLRKFSKKVRGLKLTPVKPVLEKGKAVFNRTCLRCHRSDALTGYAFDEKSLRDEFSSRPDLIERFRYRLSPSTDEGERMPLNMNILPEERRAVQAYIEKLLK